MPTKELAGIPVEVDEEGFLADVQAWSEPIAEALAREVLGSEALTEDHWRVIRFMREQYLELGVAPSLRTLGKELGMKSKRLYELFPDSPAKDSARIAGIPKPEACI